MSRAAIFLAGVAVGWVSLYVVARLIVSEAKARKALDQ